MQRLTERMRSQISKVGKNWAYVCGGLCLLEALNLSLLKRWAPFWIPTVITILIIVVTAYYLRELYVYYYAKYKDYSARHEEALYEKFEFLQKHIDEVNKQATERHTAYLNQLIASIQDHYQRLADRLNALEVRSEVQRCEEVDRIINLIEKVNSEAGALLHDEMSAVAEMVREHQTWSGNQIAQLSSSAEERIANLKSRISILNEHEKARTQGQFRVLTDTIAMEQRQFREQVHENSERILEKSSIDMSKMISRLNDVAEQQGQVLTNLFEKTWLSTAKQVNVVANDILQVMEKRSIAVANQLQAWQDVLVHLITDTSTSEGIAISALHTDIHQISDTTRSLIIQHSDAVNNAIRTYHDELLGQVSGAAQQIVEQSMEGTKHVLERFTQDGQEQREHMATSIDSAVLQMVNKLNCSFNQIRSVHTESEDRMTETILSEASVQAEAIGMLRDELANVLDGIKIQLTNEGIHTAEVVQETVGEITNGIGGQLLTLRSDMEERLESEDQVLKSLSEDLGAQIGAIVNRQEVFNTLLDGAAEAIAEHKEQLEELTTAIRDDNHHLNLQIGEIYRKHTLLTERIDELNIQMVSAFQQKSEDIKARQQQTMEHLSHLQQDLIQLKALDMVIRNNMASREAAATSVRTAVDRNLSPDPSRVEEIYDDENDFLLLNSYVDNVLKTSEVRQSGQRVFVTVYNGEGLMESSQTFNEAGELTTELTYYANGAVKERREAILKDGKKNIRCTRFNERGDKI